MEIALHSNLKSHLCWSCIGLVIILIVIPGVHGQDLEPRAYANAPVGLNFIVAGYNYSTGGVATDPTVPVENAEINVNSFQLGYARTLNVWDMSSKISMVIPSAHLSGSAEYLGDPVQRDITGLADPRFGFTLNLFGAPALDLDEFKSYQQDLILGVSLKVTAPLGQYDSSKLVNIGTNRWSFEPEIGVSKRVGPLTLELAAAVNFFTNNNDYLNGQSFEQEPIYAFQGHLIYSFKAGIWFALDGTYYTGGVTTIDGKEGDTLQENTRVGATLSIPVSRRNSIKLNASSGVSTRTGSDFDTVGIAWQYRWGGGL
jgi:hypothetical protein